jgi:hypothetical protein
LVTWFKAFITAFKIILFSIIFGIIGSILIISGVMSIYILFLSTRKEITLLEYIPSIISIILGFSLSLLGFLASFLKFNAELIINDINLRTNSWAEKYQNNLPNYLTKNHPPENTNATIKETKSIDFREFFGGIIYVVIGLAISGAGYYVNTLSNLNRNSYTEYGIWTWIIIGIIIVIYGLFLITKKYLHH